MFLLGLTGSIGMGKSTTAQMFKDQDCAVWDADAAVHRLYENGGAAVMPIQQVFPDAIIDGAVSRQALKKIISDIPDALQELEHIVHPLVAQDRADFIGSVRSDIIVLDIPLLFETGGQEQMDAVACVTVSPEIQKERVMARGTMTLAQFEAIKAKQMPNDEKCARSDYVIRTETIEGARRQVQDIVTGIRRRLSDA